MEYGSSFRLERVAALNEAWHMIAEKIAELKNLSAEEKLILVGELWDDLAAQSGTLPPREDHIKLLQERLEHYRRHPEDVIAWEEVKARILPSR